MATPLATRDQLASRLKSDVDNATADLALAGSSGMVRSIGRQMYSFVSQETIDLTGGNRILVLPQRPAVVDGSNPLTVVEAAWFGSLPLTMVEGRDFERLGNELTRAYPYYWNSRLMGWPYTRPIGTWAPKVTVTYSHGYATIPDDLVKIVLDVATSLYDNPLMLRSMSIDDYSETRAVEILGASTVAGIRESLGVAGRRRGAFSIQAV